MVNLTEGSIILQFILFFPEFSYCFPYVYFYRLSYFYVWKDDGLLNFLLLFVWFLSLCRIICIVCISYYYTRSTLVHVGNIVISTFTKRTDNFIFVKFKPNTSFSVVIGHMFFIPVLYRNFSTLISARVSVLSILFLC